MTTTMMASARRRSRPGWRSRLVKRGSIAVSVAGLSMAETSRRLRDVESAGGSHRETRRRKWRSDIRSRRSEVRGQIFPGRSYFLRSIKICQRFILSSFRMPCSSQAAYTEATASQEGRGRKSAGRPLFIFCVCTQFPWFSLPGRRDLHTTQRCDGLCRRS